jgi:HD-GYP domain-containing protein (c-di-GMP phosphodiesterase class II)
VAEDKSAAEVLLENAELQGELRALRRRILQLEQGEVRVVSRREAITTSNVFRLVELKTQQLEETNEQLEKLNRELKDSNEKTQRYYISTVITLARLQEARSPYFQNHSLKVARACIGIGPLLGYSKEEIDLLEKAALLHDFGMIGIRYEVVQKSGPLTEEEYNHVKTHPHVAQMVIEPIGVLDRILNWIVHHHERPDGRGYPDGLSGDDLPRPVRLLQAADAYVAMGSDRPHRKALSQEAIRRELDGNAGGQFDPEVVRALYRWLRWV